ncbi:MAG TPA: glycosyltransferase family 2 protein [Blastocatellia bacterium]|nr:glycosyltransferase family 2 protein [Blastocatellia bacterium]
MQDFPKVSILVPARNEAGNISKCLNSLAKLNYPKFDVTVIDDGSTDHTGEIARGIAEKISVSLNVVRNESLPSGWVGKNHALHIGQETVSSDWLLFTDADTFHYADSLKTAIQFALEKGLDFLSYSPEQECVTFWEKVAQPMVFSFLSRRFALKDINNGDHPAAANGQYILISRKAYDLFGGHQAVKGEVLEDVALARLARSKGLRVGFYPGAGLVRTRMYRTFREIWNGWTKGLFPLLDYRLGAVIKILIVVLFTSVLPIIGLAIAAVLLLSLHYVIAVVLAALMAGILVAALLEYRTTLQENRFPDSSLFLFPLSGLLFVSLLIASVYRHKTKSIKWKDRTYDA